MPVLIWSQDPTLGRFQKLMMGGLQKYSIHNDHLYKIN